MRVLVTGGNGFVGKHLVASLKKDGHTVIKVPREVFNDPRHLEPFIIGVSPIDMIFHLAAYGNHHHQQDAAEMVQVNYAGTFNLLTATKNIPYKAFINVSTSSVLIPHETVYSATKAGAERLVRAFVAEFAKPVMTLRPYSLYGEGEGAHRFIPKVFDSFMRETELTLSPEPVHDWVHVSDFVQAMRDCAEILSDTTLPPLQTPLQEREVGTARGTSNQQVVDLIQKLTKKRTSINKHKTLRAYDNKEWVADVPWRKKMIQIGEGLKRYYEWYTEEK
jgi:nucleoside-diphosphate-sugar epimerase